MSLAEYRQLHPKRADVPWDEYRRQSARAWALDELRPLCDSSQPADIGRGADILMTLIEEDGRAGAELERIHGVLQDTLRRLDDWCKDVDNSQPIEFICELRDRIKREGRL